LSFVAETPGAMAKKKKDAPSNTLRYVAYAGIAAAAVFLNFWLPQSGLLDDASTPKPAKKATPTTTAKPPKPAAEKPKAAEETKKDSKGWKIGEQQDFIGELIKLTQRLETDGDSPQVKAEINAELVSIEKRVDEAAKKSGEDKTVEQQRALIEMIRSAMNDGQFAEDDKELEEKFGLHTYSSATFWEDSYKQGNYGDEYEWYVGYQSPTVEGITLQDLLKKSMPPESGASLMLGCGNSPLGGDLYDDGWRDITNADISETVINTMKDRFESAGKPMKWVVADCTSLSEDWAGGYGSVVEKGLMDALFSGTGSAVEPTLKEVHRVLKPGGTFVSVTHAGNRKDLLERHVGTCEVQPLTAKDKKKKKARPGEKEDSGAVFAYVCTKGT